MIVKVLITGILIIIIWQYICLHIYGWGDDDGERIPSEQIRSERKRILKMFLTDHNDARVVSTTIGWRPDPWNHEDGYTETRPGVYEKTIRNGKDYK